jgi:hypothetical protein
VLLDPLDPLEAKPEPLEEEPEPPRLPAADVPPPALEPDEEPELADPEPDPAAIESPGVTVCNDATVPAAGARNFVSASASWAFWSVTLAL